MEQKGLGIVIMAFVVILFGVITIEILGNQTNAMGTADSVNNDSMTGSNTTCTQVTTGCIAVLDSLDNGSTRVGSVNYTACRTSTGNIDGILLYEGKYHGVTLNATYRNSPDCTYVADGTSRTIINLVLIFFAIAIVAVGIMMFNKMREGWE